VRIGVEATGNFGWFQRLMQELAMKFSGDATEIRARIAQAEADKRDARHILSLVQDRFPAIWQPRWRTMRSAAAAASLPHVRMRTRIKNQLDGMARRRLLSPRVWSPRREQIEGCR